MKRDYYAGALIAFIGAVIGVKALEYPAGTLLRMGPGMFPQVLCVILVALGALIAINATSEPSGPASAPDAATASGHDEIQSPDWRGCAAIVIGMVAFIILTHYAGLMPGTFCCVLIAALGDKDSTWLGSLVLSASVTVLGMLLFVYGLKMNLPLFKWVLT